MKLLYEVIQMEATDKKNWKMTLELVKLEKRVNKD